MIHGNNAIALSLLSLNAGGATASFVLKPSSPLVKTRAMKTLSHGTGLKDTSLGQGEFNFKDQEGCRIFESLPQSRSES